MENSNQKQSSNFFLLLKQGFKGIFRFRVQFIIILILSFLATFVLTISVSTSRRLDNAYQNIVKKIDPFDLVGSTRISDTAANNPGGAELGKFRSTAITDFLNNTFVSVQDQAEETGKEIYNSSYNFIFNSDAYKNLPNTKTFLTKVMDVVGDQSFYQLTVEYYQSLTEVKLNKDETIYQTDLLRTQNSYTWALKEQFATQLIKDLIAYRDNPENPEVGYLANTSFDLLLRINPEFFDFVGDRFNKTDFYNFNAQEKRFIRYLYWISAQPAAWITDQDKIFGHTKENENGSKPPSIFDKSDEGGDEVTTPEDQAEVFYEFLLGRTYNGAAAKRPNFIIDDVHKPYTLTTTMREGWSDDTHKEEYLLVSKDEDKLKPFSVTNDQRSALMVKGFKGITSPLSVTIGDIKYIPGQGPIEPYKGIRAVKFTENTEEFSLLSYNSYTPLNKTLNLELDFSYDYDIMDFEVEKMVANKSTLVYGWNSNDGNVKASMMQYHIEFTALSVGLNVRFRKESIVFDNITSRKFRFVILNTRDDANFTMLRGTAPSAVNEVAISQQFAQANKIKVGQYLSVGGTLVMVTGFATDAFTFFPNVDPDVPIPQPKTEAVIFGSKDTLTKIHRGNGNSSDGQNADPQMFSFFLTNNKKVNRYNLAMKKNLFTSLQMDLASQLKNNFDYLAKNIGAPETKHQSLLADDEEPILESFFGLKNFDDSNYRLSWTLMPLVLTVFQAITYVASAIIAIIAIIALVICIRKTINFNAKQIGILKAMGTNPWMIAVTYLAHSIVILGIIVPSAWIIGTGLQVPFSMIFTKYFSAPTNIVLVDWISIVITLFGFGVLAVLTSMVAAYLVTRKPVVEIINVSVKWSNSKIVDRLNDTVFKNASFHSRFSLTLLSSGKKPVILLVVVVGLTSLLISGAIAVPAVANNVISSYYKSIKYANAYDNVTPTVNSPLTKTAINFWQGNQKWDKDWHEGKDAQLKLDSTKALYGYYGDPEGYMDSVSQASPIPKYIYKENINSTSSDALVQNFTYAYAYLLQNPEQFLPLATAAFGNNFFTVLGQSFNIGTIDQFFGLILNSNYETIKELMGGFIKDGGKYNPDLTLDANKQQLAFEFSGSLTLALPNIISIIFQATSGGDTVRGDGVDWKNDVINVIMTQVPPYIRSYIEKSGSRTEQFSISFNAEPYVPKKESFVTKFSAQTDKYNNVPITGIDDNQNAIALTKSDRNRLFLDNDSLAKIEQIMNGNGGQIDSFSSKGMQIWNKDTATLTLPMLDNHQSATGYKLQKNGLLKNVSTTTRQLKFRTQDGWEVLPKNAWAYDDSDFWNSNLFSDPKKTLKLDPKLNLEGYQNVVRQGTGATMDVNGNSSSWLDIYALDNSRFTYNIMFDKDKNLELKTDSYFFNDFAFGQNHQISASFARPYYNYRNIKLFLPKNLINEEDILKSSENSSEVPEGTDEKWSWFYHAKANQTLKLESGKEVPGQYMVPDSALEAWGYDPKNRDDTEFLVINPYDLKYAGDGGEAGSLDRLINGTKYPYWGRYAFDSDYGPGALTYQNAEPVVYGQYNPQRKDFKINFQVVGTVDSYDSRLLLTDATLANMILGYSTARTVGVSNTYLTDNSGPDTEHNAGERPWKPQLDVFNFNKPQLDVLVYNRTQLAKQTYLKNLKDANNYQPLKWHTGKLSNIDEPVNLTSAVSFNVRDNLGFYSLGLMYPLGLGVNILVQNQVLLSTQKALINQIYSLAISLGALLIVAIVLTASLLIMLVGDVYIAQYLRFMILMRALGYSNRAIQIYAFGAVSILSLVMWIITTILAWILIFGFIKLMATWGFAIPYALSWWPPLVSFAIIFISFFGSLLVSSGKVRRGEVSSLVNESNE